MVEGDFAVVAVFEFAVPEDAPEAARVERDELYRGDEASCERVAAALERATRTGRRGLVYRGERADAPVHAVVAVMPPAEEDA